MKIATYNVNGENRRLPVPLRWIELARPGIACLQELKAPQEKFPEKPLRDLGYDVIWHGQSRWNGVALLSRVGSIHEICHGRHRADPRSELWPRGLWLLRNQLPVLIPARPCDGLPTGSVAGSRTASTEDYTSKMARHACNSRVENSNSRRLLVAHPTGNPCLGRARTGVLFRTGLCKSRLSTRPFDR